MTQRTPARYLLVLLMLGWAGQLCAQDEAPPAKKAHAAHAAKAHPAPAKAGGHEPSAPKATEADAVLPPPDDPAVVALLATKPATPAEWARVAKILADLQRPDLAKPFLQKVLDAKLNDKQLAALADEFGSDMFTSMSSRTELAPEAPQLSSAVLSAVNRKLQDPQHLAELIGQIADPSEEIRARALSGLEDAGGAGVEALIGVLADPARTSQHAAVHAALVQLGKPAIGPLEGLLDGAEGDVAAEASRALAELNARRAAVYLLRPALSPVKGDAKVRQSAEAALVKLQGRTPPAAAAVDTLLQEAELYLQQRQPLAENADGRVDLWRWNASDKRVIGKSYSPENASRAVAARLTRDALAIAPDDPRARMLYVVAQLEEAADDRGLDRAWDVKKDPVAQAAARVGTATLEKVLQYALAHGAPAAAAGAAQLLGDLGQAQALVRDASAPNMAPLVQAVRAADRRVSLAAAEAIVHLQPAGPFAGSSQVTEALAFLAASHGTRRALVAGPLDESNHAVAGMLASLGYQADTATTGREALRLALGSPDYEVALLDASLDNPPTAWTLQQLRRDYRTARLRVGILARAGHSAVAEHMAQDDPLTRFFAWPHNLEAVSWQMKQLQTLGPRDFVRFDQRQNEALRALACLAHLSPAVFDMGRAQEALLGALYVPQFSRAVVGVLANLGSPDAQQGLVDLAGSGVAKIEVRRAAAAAFCHSVGKYGILLTTDAIRQQYTRYNQADKQDAAGRAVLARVLDGIEAPRATTKGKP